jgi:hypothetical protein
MGACERGRFDVQPTLCLSRARTADRSWHGDAFYLPCAKNTPPREIRLTVSPVLEL